MSSALAGNVRQDRAHGPHRVLNGARAVTGSETASLIRQLKPRFLEGLTAPELQSVLAAATLRRFLANSVIVNQGNPAEHLFLLIKGRARYFFMTPDGQKMLLLWLPPGEMLGGAALLSLTCHTARQRLSDVLVNLASGIGHKVPAGVEILVSNEDLASAANVTPFTASRLLGDWQRKGLLAKSRGKVLLRDPERLLLHEV